MRRLWEATEVMTFGSVVTFYKATTRSVKQPIADQFGISDILWNVAAIHF